MILKKTIFILIAGMVLSACGVVKRGTVPWEEEPDAEPTRRGPVSASTPTVYEDNSGSQNEKEIQEALDLAYNDWKGVPYLFGGSGYSGIDCSAFMQVVFEDYFFKMLPRTTTEQLSVGRQVKKAEIQTGDMVFFKTGPNDYHVGVMVDHEQFLHASTSSGVIISTLSNDYWQETYLTTRRILDE